MVLQHENPLAINIPYSFNSQEEYPTEILANRFQAWRYIIKDLVSYFKEYASVQEEIVRQQVRLQQAFGTPASTTGLGTGGNHGQGQAAASHHGHGPLRGSLSKNEDLNAINKFFLPIGNGSIQDLPTILTKYHQQNVTNGSKTLKEINQAIVPKLEGLRKDLSVKIKEIKNLQNDFKNNLGKELIETKQLLTKYTQAIEIWTRYEHPGGPVGHGDSDQHKNDPYLVKIKLDKQLKKQVSEENYLYEAYANLQTAGEKLESIIVLEIQNYISLFLNMVSTESSTLQDYLLPNINNGFLAKEPECEWNSFISRNLPSSSSAPTNAAGNNTPTMKTGTFLDLSFPAKKLSDLVIPDYDSPLNVAIREGTLERRSKFLKSYSSGWYVLTCNFIHEFKSSDRKKDMQPVMSLPLDSCQVSERSKVDEKGGGVYKFVLTSKLQNGLIHRGHNWVFRSSTYKDMTDWYNDIKSLTALSSPNARARYVAKRLKLSEGRTISSQKALSRNPSVSSNVTGSKSVKTSNSSRQSQKNVGGTLLTKQVSGPVSTGTSRLSSTFSQKNNNQSPKLTTMVNSDGTVITPIENYQEENSSPVVYQASQHTTPQQLVQRQGSFTPTNNANLNTSNGQVQQYYDPIQQQYFTLTPTVQGQPQPQYFSATHRTGSPQYFVSGANAQGHPNSQPSSQGQVLYPVDSFGLSVYPRQMASQTPNEANGSYPTYSTQLQPPVSIDSSKYENADKQLHLEGFTDTSEVEAKTNNGTTDETINEESGEKDGFKEASYGTKAMNSNLVNADDSETLKSDITKDSTLIVN